MKSQERKLPTLSSLIFADLPHEGLDLKLSEHFSELYLPEEKKDPELLEVFKSPIEIQASVVPVASKVDLRGSFRTTLSAVCDRCMVPVSLPVQGSLDTFLMARTQFSQYDKPEGKVIHGSTRSQKLSRHHSRSKAPVLTDAEGEHEDESFGAFDGHIIDLRPLVRELLILQIPMKILCCEDCQGLCLACKGNVNQAKCTCTLGPTLIKEDETHPDMSELAMALKERQRSSSR